MPAESEAELREILGLRSVAVVGCSSAPGKDAHDVPLYLHEQGYDVVPVNPRADEIFDREAYDSLAAVEEAVDVVDVFRPGDDLAGIVDEAIARDDVRVVWTQPGIHDEAAAERAEQGGLTVVQDRCMKEEYQRLLG